MGTRGKTIAAALVAVALLGCGFWSRGPGDGNEAARNEAEWAAKQIQGEIGNNGDGRDAESVTATVIIPLQMPPEIQVVPVAWSGRASSDERGVIEIQIDVWEPARKGQSLGDPGQTAGHATACYRYTMQIYRGTAYAGIPCPKTHMTSMPSETPLPRLPDDARARLANALRTATPQTLAGTVRAAFPPDYITVDTTTTDQGTLVAAVGVPHPQTRDCIVMIKDPGAEPKPVDFPRIQLQPGESGCHTRLYTNPVR
ncbi:hypothetical protein ACPPVO_31605 [Dactylosporangium sp. McL0621]|uniref:hypothetical protein n=1 Tax=Dactylosporangium sp. McL0621 TaxID=3415678 RepID=UPI003CF65419